MNRFINQSLFVLKMNKKYFRMNIKQAKRTADIVYKSKNNQKIKEIQHNWYLKNKERIKKKNKERYHNNLEETRRKARTYYYKNRSRYKLLNSIYQHNKIKELRNDLLNIFGKKCSNPSCAVEGGMKDIRALQFDHINGGGCKEIQKFAVSHGRVAWYKHYLNNPELAKKNLQILCANCNWIKRDKNKEHGIRSI